MQPKEIKKRRLELGFSQKELAKRFAIDIDLLEDWESGAASPPHPKLVELAFIALEGNWAISPENEVEFARIRKLIDDGHKRMLETFPSA